MSGLIGKKIGMTSIFDENGKNMPCTVIECGPCVVTQVRTMEVDGYEALQLGFDDKKTATKAAQGHFKKAGTVAKRKVAEFKGFDEEVKLGDTITVEHFAEGEFVDVAATSKGKGFQGVVKRHGFAGVGQATHGQHNRLRAPGSIGAASYPARVFKGMKMAGQMGNEKVKVQNLRVLKVVAEKNLLVVKGCIPGHKNAYVTIREIMKVAVIDSKGKDTGRKVELSKDVFGIEPNNHAVYLDVKQYLANQRQGTHKSKERAEISGSTRKIKKQKGTGTARAGSIKSGVFRGGGRMFGPRPRNYSFKLNKNLKRLARKSALTMKANDKAIVVLEDLKFDTPKTKDFTAVLKTLGLEGKKSLFVLGEPNNNVYLSSRNLEGTEVVTNSELSTYKILNANSVILFEGSLEGIESNLSK